MTTRDIPSAIHALLFSNTHAVGEPRDQDALRHVLALSTLHGESVRVVVGNHTYRADVTPYGTVALLHKTGHEFSRSVKRWCMRFAKAARAAELRSGRAAFGPDTATRTEG